MPDEEKGLSPRSEWRNQPNNIVPELSRASFAGRPLRKSASTSHCLLHTDLSAFLNNSESDVPSSSAVAAVFAFLDKSEFGEPSSSVAAAVGFLNKSRSEEPGSSVDSRRGEGEGRGVLSAPTRGFLASLQDSYSPAHRASVKTSKAQHGHDHQGQNQNGLDQNGQNQNGQNQIGLGQNGHNQNGLDQNGQNQNGLDQNGQDQNGQSQHSLDQNGQERTPKRSVMSQLMSASPATRGAHVPATSSISSVGESCSTINSSLRAVLPPRPTPPRRPLGSARSPTGDDASSPTYSAANSALLLQVSDGRTPTKSIQSSIPSLPPLSGPRSISNPRLRFLGITAQSWPVPTPPAPMLPAASRYNDGGSCGGGSADDKTTPQPPKAMRSRASSYTGGGRLSRDASPLEGIEGRVDRMRLSRDPSPMGSTANKTQTSPVDPVQ
eukprot:gene4766-34518_t